MSSAADVYKGEYPIPTSNDEDALEVPDRQICKTTDLFHAGTQVFHHDQMISNGEISSAAWFNSSAIAFIQGIYPLR
jgi:hypothetical protein